MTSTMMENCAQAPVHTSYSSCFRLTEMEKVRRRCFEVNKPVEDGKGKGTVCSIRSQWFTQHRRVSSHCTLVVFTFASSCSIYGQRQTRKKQEEKKKIQRSELLIFNSHIQEP